ncbi:DUF7857 domain-containing protein [Halogeometricum limi]|uniref:DUF8080 domain-containing protein n=1 Tax=Halogeometricum limi TaxID=555875 RepID=A0A1I6FVF8_9EURY|nr:hypothetical protein [Halogeometricum limi]SFR33797.1 hypothetical protein SAMN04488124_0359 [Halogeometricum limi]
MEYDCTTDVAAGTTLVTVRVRNDAAVDRRVSVRNTLSGPVLPPRREGVPERGWDEEGFVGVVDAESERTFGYACPVVEACADPVSVESLGRVDGESGTDLEAAAVRRLGRARPPADAVPTSADAVPASGDAVPTRDSNADRCVPDRESRRHDDAESDAATVDEFAESPSANRASERVDPVESWLANVESRAARAERLTDATAADAAAVLETDADISALPAAVDADEAALRSFARRATALADRLAETDPEPAVDALAEAL